MGQEYIRSHPTLTRLALLLAEAGFPVLRFDYFGCGDSAGFFEQATVERWQIDIDAAIDQIAELSGLSRVALFGLRLGASLALLKARPPEKITRLVLWEPIIDGRRYVEKQLQLHRDWQSGVLRQRVRNPRDGGDEISGFPLVETLREGLERIDLSRVRDLTLGEMLVIHNRAVSELEETEVAFIDQMKRSANNFQHISTQGCNVWTKDGSRVSKGLKTLRVLRQIAEWLQVE